MSNSSDSDSPSNPQGLTIRHACLIFDASCTISLYASGRFEDLIDALPVEIAIADYVYEEEALTVYSDPTAYPPVKERIELGSFVGSGKLRVVSLATTQEENAALNFARTLGNGEAITGAIAVQRNWAIAIDDRSASSFLQQAAPQLQVVTTPELIKHWADSVGASTEAIREVLYSVRTRGRYGPFRGHPLYEWWHSHMQS